jgi:hypothetical protein
MGLAASADHALPDTQKPAATEQANAARNGIFLLTIPDDEQSFLLPPEYPL